MGLFAKKGVYVGRLAFDPDSEFHFDPKGRRVVTTDEGVTWRYAVKTDTPHNARYGNRALGVNPSVDGEPHHVSPELGDRHFDGIQFLPDEKSVTHSSHTESWGVV